MGYNHQWAVELFQEFLTRYQKELTAPMICAAEFAIDAHKGQTRKSSDIPYVSHLFEVAGILIDNKACENLIIAGLLHDVLEDTKKTVSDIECLFAPAKAREIIKIVMADTEKDKSLPWKDRKLETIAYLKRTRSKNGMLLIAADKLSNLRSFHRTLQECGENMWNDYSCGKNEQYWYFETIGKLLNNKLRNYSNINKEYKELLKFIFK